MMHTAIPAAALVLVTVVPSATAEVTVRKTGDLIDVKATSAPLADVLASLAAHTGMKVIYDGPAPQVPVTVSLQKRWPAQVVLELLEGQQIGYAFVGDGAGRTVQTVVLTTAPAAKRPAPPPQERQERPDDPRDVLRRLGLAVERLTPEAQSELGEVPPAIQALLDQARASRGESTPAGPAVMLPDFFKGAGVRAVAPDKATAPQKEADPNPRP
jgi:hypothetical protein